MRNLATLLLVLLAFLVATWLRFDTLHPPPGYMLALLTGLLLASIIMPATGAFREDLRQDLFRKTRRLVAGWATVVLALISVAALLKVSANYSRIWFGTWVVVGLVFLIASQLVEYAWLTRRRRRGSGRRPVVLVGGGDNGARVERRIEQDPEARLRVVARFGPGWGGRDAQPLEWLAEYVAVNQVSEVWIAPSWGEHGLLEQALAALKEAVVDIKVVPDLHQYRLLNQGVSEWGGLPVVNLSGTPMTGSEMRIKALFDRLSALALLGLLSPLLGLIALAIKLGSPGPVLFRQLRNGIGGENIQVLKFRTMHVHAEPAGQITQATPADDRITRLGWWLRRTSCDELPQLINVLRGEMSLVGPRPHAVEHNDLFKSRIPRYMLRHKVKPGITGWAQVHGLRGITDTPEKMRLRIEHDLWYIQNWSLWLDLRILLMTPLAMVHRNAV